jgi:hypothetical protein
LPQGSELRKPAHVPAGVADGARVKIGGGDLNQQPHLVSPRVAEGLGDDRGLDSSPPRQRRHFLSCSCSASRQAGCCCCCAY